MYQAKKDLTTAPGERSVSVCLYQRSGFVIARLCRAESNMGGAAVKTGARTVAQLLKNVSGVQTQRERLHKKKTGLMSESCKFAPRIERQNINTALSKRLNGSKDLAGRSEMTMDVKTREIWCLAGLNGDTFDLISPGYCSSQRRAPSRRNT